MHGKIKEVINDKWGNEWIIGAFIRSFCYLYFSCSEIKLVKLEIIEEEVLKIIVDTDKVYIFYVDFSLNINVPIKIREDRIDISIYMICEICICKSVLEQNELERIVLYMRDIYLDFEAGTRLSKSGSSE